MENKVQVVEKLTKEDAYNNLVYCVENFFKGSPKECAAMTESLKLLKELVLKECDKLDQDKPQEV